jgi:hypothetical protein
MSPAAVLALLEATGLIAWETWPTSGADYDVRHTAALVAELLTALVAGDPPRAADLLERIRRRQ